MENTKIAWAHDTFSIWWGCVEVSPGCDNCYARTAAHRYGFDVWGKDAPRRFFSDKHWDLPLKWNRQATKSGTRRRVFSASMSDILEERSDEMGRLMAKERDRLWSVIAQTPSLDWLLLSKRSGAFRRLVPPQILDMPNVWPGTTVESSEYLWRAQDLTELECAGPRWVSYEPAIGPVSFRDVLSGPSRIAWLIVGGESGFVRPLGHDTPRPFDLQWARNALADCREGGAAYFMKQIGNVPMENGQPFVKVGKGKGDDPAGWPQDLQVQEFPA